MQRLIAVLLLLAAMAAIVAGGLVPIATAFVERDERIAELEDRAARYQRIADRAGAVDGELVALQSAARLDHGSFDEATTALAAATLQERLRELVTGAGGVLASTRVMPERDAGPYTLVSVEARLRLDVAGLQQVLYGLESGERLLRIDQLTVRSLNRGARRAQQASDNLDVLLQVVGFRRAADAKGS